jgi:hypothetical protein
VTDEPVKINTPKTTASLIVYLPFRMLKILEA